MWSGQKEPFICKNSGSFARSCCVQGKQSQIAVNTLYAVFLRSACSYLRKEYRCSSFSHGLGTVQWAGHTAVNHQFLGAASWVAGRGNQLKIRSTRCIRRSWKDLLSAFLLTPLGCWQLSTNKFGRRGELQSPPPQSAPPPVLPLCNTAKKGQNKQLESGSFQGGAETGFADTLWHLFPPGVLWSSKVR